MALVRVGYIALALLLSIVAPMAGPVEDALDPMRGDFATGFETLHRLADQGDSHAQAVLGAMYAAGQGVPQNATEALIWLRKAADQGEAAAQSTLGAMYYAGWGNPRDYSQALMWYRKAADQGEAFAQYNLGTMYSNGEGVPRDYVQAYKWVNLAAKPEAEIRTKAVQARNVLVVKMTPAQIAEAKRLISEWKQITREPPNF